jgi:cytochrome c-type biogenesis protein CcmH/NrfG
MDLFTLLFGWPLLPLQGVIRLGELIQEQAEREMRDPVAVRRQLEELEQAADAGLISEEEQAAAMEEILRRMTGPPVLMDSGEPDPWESGR